MQVIRTARKVGGPLLVAALDGMEPWQIAEALGMADDEVVLGDDGEPLTRPQAPVSSGRDLVAERVRAARDGLPEPEPDAPTPEQVALYEQMYRLAHEG